MHFPIALHQGGARLSNVNDPQMNVLLDDLKDDSTGGYGVSVPDVQGCHAWGATVEEALHNTRRAIDLHIATMLEHGMEPVLQASGIERWRADPLYADAFWALVDVDLSKFEQQPERVNISLPHFALKQIDAFADWNGETRSAFLRRAAFETMVREIGSSDRQNPSNAQKPKNKKPFPFLMLFAGSGEASNRKG